MATPTEIHGLGTNDRVAIGPVAQVRRDLELPADEDAARDADPRGRVRSAFAAVHRELSELAAHCDGTLRDVLEATAEMADDPTLHDAVRAKLDCGVPPARAVHDAVEDVCTVFEAAGGLLADRVTDVRSMGDRVVATLLGRPAPGAPLLTRPSVVVADDLAPADTAGLDPAKLLALVTERGGPTGHTAIIAGQLGIPCVVQAAGATEIADGTTVAVDAASGRVTVNPNDALVSEFERRERVWRAWAADRRPGATADGHRVQLLANIGTDRDAEALADSGAEGVGLFRTEMLFLDRESAPTPEEQAEVYARVFAAMGSAQVVVRTLDCGADKPIPFLHQEREDNPALGVRGYRLMRTDPAVVEGQLRAIALAAQRTGADPWVMAPMISIPQEAAEFASAARAAGLRTVGAMVEVPAAALQAELLLESLDFASLGTNDLAQYTMGTDRLQHRLSDLLDPWQPAVLRLVAATAAAGRAAGKPIGVCGESAADPVMALVLTGLGVTSLSMSPVALPAVRHALAGHTLTDCEHLAKGALAAPSASAARMRTVAALDPEVRRTLALETSESVTALVG